MKLAARKSLLLILFVAMFWESFYAPRGSNPGRTGALILAWAIGTRQFLATPSYTLIMFGVFCAASCLASNHGLFTAPVGVPWLDFYLICGVLIMWWERIVGFFHADHSVDHQT